MLVSALQAIDSGNVSLIRDASEELKAQVENRIEMKPVGRNPGSIRKDPDSPDGDFQL